MPSIFQTLLPNFLDIITRNSSGIRLLSKGIRRQPYVFVSIFKEYGHLSVLVGYGTVLLEAQRFRYNSRLKE